LTVHGRRGLPAHRLALLAVACAACAPVDGGTFSVDPSLKSFLLVARQTDVRSAPIAGYAFLPPPRAILAGLGDEATVVLFGYERSLEELAFVPLEPGRTSSAAFAVAISPTSDVEGRPLPRETGHLWLYTGGGFSAIAELPAALVDARLPDLDSAKCAALGRCQIRYGGSEICSSSCAPVEPAPPIPPNPPSPPALPVLTPCPSGWLIVTATIGDGATLEHCRPPAWQSPPRCGPAEAIFYGDSGCHPLGPPCPAGRFDPVIIADLYVDAAAAPGGSGTRLSPLSDLDAAISRAATQGLARIALATGDYRLGNIETRGVELLGACTSGTRLLLAQNATIDAGASRFSALTLVGARRPIMPVRSFALAVRGPASLSLEDVVLEDAQGPALGVSRAALTTRHVRIHGAEVGGLDLYDSQADLDALSIEDIQGHGLQILGGQVRAQGLLIRGLSGSPEGSEALGIILGEGATFALQGGAITDLDGYGIDADTSSATLDQLRIQGLRRYQGLAGGAIGARGSTLSITAAAIADLEAGAIYVSGGSTLELSRSALVGTSRLHTGVDCASARRCSLWASSIVDYRSSVAANGTTEVWAADLLLSQGTFLIQESQGLRVDRLAWLGIANPDALYLYRAAGEISDLWLDALPQPPFGTVGLRTEGSTLSIHRARLAGAATLMLLSRGETTLTDLELEHNAGPAPVVDEGQRPGAIMGRLGALRIERASMHDLYDQAMFLVLAQEVSIRDLDVADVHHVRQSIDAALNFFWDQETPRLLPMHLERLRIVRAQGGGLATEDRQAAGAIDEILDLEVRDTAEDCGVDTQGHKWKCGAVDLRAWSQVNATRWLLEGNSLRSLKAAAHAGLRAADLRIRGNGPAAGIDGLLALEDSVSILARRFTFEQGALCLTYQGSGLTGQPSLRLEQGRLDCTAAIRTGCRLDGLEVIHDVVLGQTLGEHCNDPMEQSGR